MIVETGDAEYWLEPGAAVPVDIATTAALVTEIQRLRQALEQPEREWVGLTDDEIVKASIGHVEGKYMLPHSFARAIEAKLKEKNK